MKIKNPLQKKSCCFLLLLFSVASCAFGYYFGSAELKFSGYCPSKQETLTYKEIADKALKQIFSDLSQNRKFPYNSLDEFYKRNPHCCSFYVWADPDYKPLWLQRAERYFFGKNIPYVYQITGKYYDPKYDPNPAAGTFSYAVNACGDVNGDEGRILSAVPADPVQFVIGHPYSMKKKTEIEYKNVK